MLVTPTGLHPGNGPVMLGRDGERWGRRADRRMSGFGRVRDYPHLLTAEQQTPFPIGRTRPGF
jgi:hypothetical protein